MTSPSTFLRTVGNNDAIRLTVDARGAAAVLQAAPKIAYFRIRDYLFQILLQHRKLWLQVKGNKFGRGTGETGSPIRVRQINDGGGPARPNDVAYNVSPSDKRAPSSAGARDLLGRLSAEIYTGNVVLPIHEFGTDINSVRWMSVPVKTRPSSPARWRAKYPNKDLLALPSKRDGKVLLYEKTKKRATRGRPRKGAAPDFKERLRLRFILTKTVDMKPTLRLYDTWEQLAAEREKAWGATADKMQADFAKNDPRDR